MLSSIAPIIAINRAPDLSSAQVFAGPSLQTGIQTRSRRLVQKERDNWDIADEDCDYVESEDDDEEFHPGIKTGKKRSKSLRMKLDNTVKTMEMSLPLKRTNQSIFGCAN